MVDNYKKSSTYKHHKLITPLNQSAISMDDLQQQVSTSLEQSG